MIPTKSKEGSKLLNISAIIAVRMRSKRLYGKPLCLIEGKPIVGHLIDIFRKVPEISSVVLATSSNEENKIFVDYVRQNGLFCYVDVSHNEEDVLGRLIRAANVVKAEHIVRATSEGAIRYHNIGEVIRHHLETDADLTFTEKLPGGTNVEVLSLSSMKKAYKLDDKYHCAMVSLCMCEHPEMFKIEVLTPPKEVQRPELDLDVDTEGNLFAVKEIFRNVNRDENGFVRVEDALAFLEKQPHLIKMLMDGRKVAEGRIWE
jgi:spore coat polysaccharide biosynthesis protein SpsF